jgi:hypothetical protein
MLPTPAELRALADDFRQAVQKVTVAELKQWLARHALALAQVAEQIERDFPLATFVRTANIERYKRLLAEALDPRTRATVYALLGRENDAVGKHRREIRAWRMRAEEIRTTADNFRVPSVQASLRTAADNYDRMANHAEALLAGRPPSAIDKAG